MEPKVHNGWLMVPYSGPDTDIIDIGVSPIVGVPPRDHDWKPAFLDYHEEHRIAKVKIVFAGQSFEVYTRENGVNVRKAGKVIV